MRNACFARAGAHTPAHPELARTRPPALHWRAHGRPHCTGAHTAAPHCTALARPRRPRTALACTRPPCPALARARAHPAPHRCARARPAPPSLAPAHMRPPRPHTFFHTAPHLLPHRPTPVSSPQGLPGSPESSG
eukprot:356354-Chlamydomonas_euryale.AAC.1